MIKKKIIILYTCHLGYNTPRVNSSTTLINIHTVWSVIRHWIMFDSLGLFDEISHCAWFNIRKYNHLPHDSKEGAQIFFFYLFLFFFYPFKRKGNSKKGRVYDYIKRWIHLLTFGVYNNSLDFSIKIRMASLTFMILLQFVIHLMLMWTR